jgi:glycosyltransferase involved in cell wall biosynthesis
MRLLVTTQAVDLDDGALAFFHGWLALLAARFEAVEVICLKEGRHTLPANVHVHTLGKSASQAENTTIYGSILRRIRYTAQFYGLLWQLRGRYDAVFVHMNPEYVVLAGWLWRMRGTRVVLWYTHRQVNLKLRIAALFVHAIATAAPESLRLTSPKVRVIGHGIDTAAFGAMRDGSLKSPVSLISVGRITPIKRLEVLIDVLALLAKGGRPAELILVGEPVYPADRAYQAGLKARVKELQVGEAVRFVGALPYSEMPARYRAADLSVNLAPTGGIDKAVLESMAAGAIPIVANRAFESLFGPDALMLIFDGSAKDLARAIERVAALSAAERRTLTERLGEVVRKEADIAGVINRLVGLLTEP